MTDCEEFPQMRKFMKAIQNTPRRPYNEVSASLALESQKSMERIRVLIGKRDTIMNGKFSLGQVVATPGVLETISELDRISALVRHRNGDWGEICIEDRQSNDEALESAERLISSYTSTAGVKFWVITEHDRSITTILLPEEY
jgi:hypothetical protein